MKASRLFQWRWLGVPLLLLVAACDQQPLEVEVDVEELAVAPQFSSHAAGVGAPIFLSGDDADDAGHCGGTACGGLYPTALKFVYDNSTGGTGIAVIGANGSSARNSFISWNSPGNGGPGAPVTYVSNISTVDFTSFRMIYIASVNIQTAGGMTSGQLAALNGRQADIVTMVNTLGRGVMALTEANMAGQYGWLPLTLTTGNVSHSSGIVKTPAMAAISPVTSPQLNHGCCYHSIYTGPDGFSGLNVLAFHDHNGNGVYDGYGSADEVVILGGAQVTIQGNISLSPANAAGLPTGTQHTVIAHAQDGSPPSPAVGATVSFSVTSGPNSGTSGTATADGSGNASFTYTGSGGPGTDNIVATFTDAAGALQTSNTVQATWEQVVDPPTVSPLVTGDMGDNGWYIGDVDVDWDIDLKGGTQTSPACGHYDVDADTGGDTFTCEVTTEGGTASATVTIKRDATAPTATGTAAGTEGNNGWFTSDVDVTWATDDNLSGVVSTTCAASTESTDGSHTVSCSVTDEAGNTGTGSIDFKIDQTPPAVVYGGNALTYDISAEVAITCSASDPVPGSGLLSDTCEDIAGPAYTFGLGTSTFSATGTDEAGNMGSGSTSFNVTVSYDGVCALVNVFVSHQGVANSLCVKLAAAARAEARGNTNARNGSLEAFIHEVGAQDGNKVDPAGRQILIAMANALMG